MVRFRVLPLQRVILRTLEQELIVRGFKPYGLIHVGRCFSIFFLKGVECRTVEIGVRRLRIDQNRLIEISLGFRVLVPLQENQAPPDVGTRFLWFVFNDGIQRVECFVIGFLFSSRQRLRIEGKDESNLAIRQPETGQQPFPTTIRSSCLSSLQPHRRGPLAQCHGVRRIDIDHLVQILQGPGDLALVNQQSGTTKQCADLQRI